MPENEIKRFTPKPPSGGRRLWRAMIKRPDLGHVVVAVLVGLLGFGAALQVRSDEDDVLANARRDELFQILDGLTRQGDRLEDQVADLETDRRELLSGADTEQAALEQALERAEQLRILTGTGPATGPGILITISDPDGNVRASTMLSAVQELRASGAEAIQISGAEGAAVRIVASSYFLDSPSGSGMEISGVELQAPYTVVAIGEASRLAEAVRFPLGVIAKVESAGGTATVNEFGADNPLTIDVLHESITPEYARPAPENDR